MNIVHSGVGAVSNSDLDLAQACGACIVGFNVKSGGSVNLSASQASVKVPYPVLFQIIVSLCGFISYRELRTLE